MIKSRDSKPDVQEMECLVTAGGISVFVYEHSTTGEAWNPVVPVVRVSLIQPAFNCTRRADSDTIQMSCFDISLAKCKSNTRSAGTCLCCLCILVKEALSTTMHLFTFYLESDGMSTNNDYKHFFGALSLQFS